ncbi:MAG: hypothetical protein HY518_02640 [Candidatus Aenigmarchaeota archaeon]|nr:hypothetical protein [Candidatus Aenigmarchaeota archaeon]
MASPADPAKMYPAEIRYDIGMINSHLGAYGRDSVPLEEVEGANTARLVGQLSDCGFYVGGRLERGQEVCDMLLIRYESFFRKPAVVAVLTRYPTGKRMGLDKEGLFRPLGKKAEIRVSPSFPDNSQ